MAGNPNSRKTSKYNDKIIKVVDLPGTYSLAGYSDNEIVAKKYLLSDSKKSLHKMRNCLQQ